VPGNGTFTATSAVGGKTGTTAAIDVNVGQLDNFLFTLATPQQNDRVHRREHTDGPRRVEQRYYGF